jgi:hypothetical protein
MTRTPGPVDRSRIDCAVGEGIGCHASLTVTWFSSDWEPWGSAHAYQFFIAHLRASLRSDHCPISSDQCPIRIGTGVRFHRNTHGYRTVVYTTAMLYFVAGKLTLPSYLSTESGEQPEIILCCTSVRVARFINYSNHRPAHILRMQDLRLKRYDER